MIIANITDLATSNIFYIGEEECRLNDIHYKPYIVDFKPTQRRIEFEYGGMVKLSGEGSISIAPTSLKWPPPLKLTINIKDVDVYGRIVDFFECTAYIETININYNTYVLYSKEYDVQTLDNAPDFPNIGTPTEENRVYPLVIGTVSCILPLRVGNDTDQSYYHKASISGTDPSRSGGDYEVFDSGYQRDIYSYSAIVPESWAWTVTGSLNTARNSLAGCGIQSAALSFGGYYSYNLAVTEKFDGSSWTVTSSLNTARNFLAGCGTQSAALSFGGTTGSVTNITEKFDGSSWTVTGNLNTSRSGLAGCGIQSAALSFGGSIPSSDVTEKFDGSSWTVTGSLNTSRSVLAGCGTQSAALSFGGYDSTLYSKSDITEKFNGLSWSLTGSLNTSRFDIAGCGIQSAALSFGGSVPSTSNVTEKFEGSTWSITSNLNIARYTLSGCGTQSSGLSFGGQAGSTSAVTEKFNYTPQTGGSTGTIVDHSVYFESVLSYDGITYNPPLTEFRISGTNDNITTLIELFEWAIIRINVALSTSYILDTTYARSPSPSVNCYLTEQENIFDTLSKIAAWCTHLFYIDENNSEIVLVDMFVSNGSLHLSDDDGNVLRYLKNEYIYPRPLKSVKCNWVEFSSGINNDGYPQFIQKNKSQTVITENLSGTEESVEPYTYDVDDIISSLISIGKLLQNPRVTVEISLLEGDINPGIRLYWTDSRLKQKSTVSMRVSTIQYLPMKPEYKITAEGYVYE